MTSTALASLPWRLGRAWRALHLLIAPPWTATTDDSRDMLAALREIAPHMMTANERGVLWLAPKHITLYRGACCSTFEDAWQGLSWTTCPDDAGGYAKMRAIELHSDGLRDGWLWFVQAVVPRTAVLAFISFDGRETELIVDYTKLEEGNVTDLLKLTGPEIATFRREMTALNLRAPRTSEAA